MGGSSYTTRQTFELGFAIAAPLTLVPVAVLLLFADWSTTTTCRWDANSGADNCVTTSQRLLEAGISAAGWMLIAALVGVFLLVPVFAFHDVRYGFAPSRYLLRMLGFALLGFAVISGFSIGVFLFPGALFAAASAVASLGSKRRTSTSLPAGGL